MTYSLKLETCFDAASESKDTTCLALLSCQKNMNVMNKLETLIFVCLPPQTKTIKDMSGREEAVSASYIFEGRVRNYLEPLSF